MKSKNTTIKTKNIPNIKETNKIGLFKSLFIKSSSLTNKISANISLGPIIDSLKNIKKT